MAYNFTIFKNALKEKEEWLKKELANIRTGRANPAILDGVMVESYGTMLPVSQVGTVSLEGPRALRITPWEKPASKAIEKAVTVANLGLAIQVDDSGVRVVFPELTGERRESFVKMANQKVEEARVGVRKERDKTWDDIQQKEKEGGMGEDEKFRLKNEMQKMVDETNKKFDEQGSKKEKEILG